MPSHTMSLLHHGLVVSVQAAGQEPLNTAACIEAMAKSVVNGGAAGLRLAGTDHVARMRAIFPGLPIIAITKPEPLPPKPEQEIYITPTLNDALSLAKAGADVIAMDATDRPRVQGQTLHEIVEGIRRQYSDILLMADIARMEDWYAISNLGFDLVSTTLAGYTAETASRRTDSPDWAFLQALVAEADIPVVLEGRVWTPEDVSRGFELGASTIVVGSAATRPQLITERLIRLGKPAAATRN